ncbi:hypothetical protein SLEP1_g40987 [Rubroshorea leprosula]|uniref:Uncharacterized protein n=1 Tax=Rubroshorea leprosula TaxID=152421 RepID=A0AAV5L5A3_9ROSI|nr:hypothetical protein SLEP1_g40987 [Rubroshorea leprosula]
MEEEEGCSPMGNFEIPLEVARKATVADGEAKIASNGHIRKECTSPKGYKKEVEVLKELRVEEEEKEKMSDSERASSNAPQKVHFRPSQVKDRQEEFGPKAPSSPNGSSKMRKDIVDNNCLSVRRTNLET